MSESQSPDRKGHLQLLAFVKSKKLFEFEAKIFASYLEKECQQKIKGNGILQKHTTLYQIAKEIIDNPSDYSQELCYAAYRFSSSYKVFMNRIYHLTLEFQEILIKPAKELQSRLGGHLKDWIFELEKAFEQALFHLQYPNYNYIKQWIIQKRNRLFKKYKNNRNFSSFSLSPHEAPLYMPNNHYPNNNWEEAEKEIETEEGTRGFQDEEIYENEGKETETTYFDNNNFSYTYDTFEEEQINLIEKGTLLSKIFYMPVSQDIKLATCCFLCALNNSICKNGQKRLQEINKNPQMKAQINILVSFAKAQKRDPRRIPQCPSKTALKRLNN